jgi:hypothetical protein
MQDTGNVEQRTFYENETHDIESVARAWLANGCEQERSLDWQGAIESYRLFSQIVLVADVKAHPVGLSSILIGVPCDSLKTSIVIGVRPGRLLITT